MLLEKSFATRITAPALLSSKKPSRQAPIQPLHRPAPPLCLHSMMVA